MTERIFDDDVLATLPQMLWPCLKFALDEELKLCEKVATNFRALALMQQRGRGVGPPAAG